MSSRRRRCVEEVIKRARAAGVDHMVAIGGSACANQIAVELAMEYPGVLSATVGFDRDQAEASLDHSSLIRYCEEKKVVGIGETGLDYFYSKATRKPQLELLEKMLELSRRFSLPVVLHSREATEDTIALLRDHAGGWSGESDRKGVLHCFTGDVAFARKLLELDYYISFSGILTFKKTEALQEVAAYVPEERLLIETDSPYLAPVPYRGKRNEPAYLTQVAETLTRLRGLSLELLAKQTTANAQRLFNLEA